MADCNREGILEISLEKLKSYCRQDNVNNIKEYFAANYILRWRNLVLGLATCYSVSKRGSSTVSAF